MKTISSLAGFLIVLFILSPQVVALFSSSYDLKGTLTEQTEAFFIGKTKIEGAFSGIPMDRFVSSSLAEGMGGFPLIGSHAIDNLEMVIVAEDIDITNVSYIEDLLIQQIDNLTSYTNVDIIIDDGLYLLGLNQGTISVSADLSYAISTFIPLELFPGSTARFLCLATSSPLLMDCSGNYGVLTSVSQPTAIQIKERNGRTLWTSSSSKDYLIIQDSRFSVTRSSSLSFLPLSDTPSIKPLTIKVTSANPRDISIHQLIENVSRVVAQVHEVTPPEFLETFHTLDDIVQTTSFVTNGAIVFLRINQTMTIDHSTQRFSSTGFVRFSSLDLSKVGSTNGPTIQADSVLCYLGNHFYTPAAKRSVSGIAFPYELIIIWIFAICAFIYIRFFLKPPVDAILDAKLKRYGLLIHLIGLAAAFLLLDLEVYLLFGISAITAILSTGVSMMTGVFFMLESIVWIVGFAILGVPIQLLSYTILRFLGIGKGGNGVWKAVGDLSIWVFSAFYLLLVFNVLLALIDFSHFFPLV